FGLDVKVMRNLPMRRELPMNITRKTLNLPEDKNILLMQGAGINIERGSEEALQAMQYTNNTLLLIIGGGDAIDDLKAMASKLQLNDKARFIGKLPFEELMQYTILADIGLTLDKDTNINYRYSLPNKLFDYIHAGLPVLASPLIEVRKIVEQYNIGMCIESHDPQEIANKVKSMLADKIKLALFKENAVKASAQLCWENEKKVLFDVLKTL
ncbi:MAG TPA: glycosyltransferase, partial [Bacteroidia bacterium]|nr:glycosyltransferase [Bacteroidia bacterium]